MTDDQFPSQPELSEQLPRYRLIRKLAETRMSVIYLAEEKHLGDRQVALKVIAPALAYEPAFRERFRRETLSAANLSHPGIVPVFSAPADDELLYLVMPYIDGPNLRDLLKAGPPDLAWTVHLIRSVASALDFAHANGVVHRDVKPGNILVERQTGRVWLCDFGIAAPVLGERLTEVGRRVGTPGYLAPELIPGGEADAAPVDPRADVYSLGVVLYQCLTGRAPHQHSDTNALLWAQGHEDPPPVTSVRPELPPALDEVLATALAKRPADRYASCTELAGELAAAVSGGRVRGARRRGTPRRTVNWKPAAAIAAAAAVVAAAVVFVVNGAGGTAGASPVFRVPPPLRGDCDETSAALPGGETALDCRDGDRFVRFTLFPDRSTMDNAYGGLVGESGIASDRGDCTVATGAEHRYPNAGDQTGRVLCHTDGGTTRLVWTDDERRTVAQAEIREADDQRLVDEWKGWAAIPAFPTPAEQSLIDLVELSRCERTRAGTLATFRDLRAAIDCDPVSDGAAAVSYFRFSTVDALRRTHDQHAATANAPTGVDCTGAEVPPNFLGNRPYDLRSVDLGSMLCYQGARDTPVLEWTLEPLRLMVRATGSGTPADLVRWFKRTYGLPLPAIVAAVNETATPPFPRPAESALLAHVPDNTRNNCMRPSAGQVETNEATGATAAVVCGPSPGAPIVFYYQFPDKASMDASHTAQSTVSGGDCLANPPGFAADAPYARGGDTGRLQCGTGPHENLYLIWTSDRTDILGLAFQGYTREDLLTWWRDGAGPVL
ncbi:serine/threonine-protein kinase [Actinophytocola glycyrrhizae]|uniref:non-specific serine/threonine protein kinase n=1 Tax=Actinophytocola glycyrrhizae TaxID=2044873 RepID=A0ABV9SEC1_9PSEU